MDSLIFHYRNDGVFCVSKGRFGLGPQDSAAGLTPGLAQNRPASNPSLLEELAAPSFAPTSTHHGESFFIYELAKLSRRPLWRPSMNLVEGTEGGNGRMWGGNVDLATSFTLLRRPRQPGWTHLLASRTDADLGSMLLFSFRPRREDPPAGTRRDEGTSSPSDAPTARDVSLRYVHASRTSHNSARQSTGTLV